MKVGYLCSDVDVPVLGNEGCSIHIRELTGALADAGHDVFVVCAWKGEGATARVPVHELAAEGLDAAAWETLESEPVVQGNHLDRDLRSVLYNGWLQGAGAARFEQERPDFLYERSSLFGWGGVELARRLDVPLILEVNARLPAEQDGYEKFTLTETARRAELDVFHRADAILAVATRLRDRIVADGVDANKVHVVRNAVRAELFGGEPDGVEVRARHGLDGKRVIGFVGSFQPWHDMAGLLRAFSAVRERHEDAHLLLVGYGELRDATRSLASELGLAEDVTFAGGVPHETVPAHLGAADVLTAPYGADDLEFSPLKVYEYMASGRPTVAAAVGEIPHVIEHGETGWLYPPGDTDRLTEGLTSLLESPALSRDIGERARARALREHTWEGVADTVVGLAERLRAERRDA